MRPRDSLYSFDEDRPGVNGSAACSVADMSVQHCYGLVLEMANALRRFVTEHKGDDTVLREAFDVLTEHDEAFDALAFERGENGRAHLLMLRLGSLLETHPVGGPLLRRLFEHERRARARAIDLLRQSAHHQNQ